jgi:hypothetical protein
LLDAGRDERAFVPASLTGLGELGAHGRARRAWPLVARSREFSAGATLSSETGVPACALCVSFFGGFWCVRNRCRGADGAVSPSPIPYSLPSLELRREPVKLLDKLLAALPGRCDAADWRPLLSLGRRDADAKELDPWLQDVVEPCCPSFTTARAPSDVSERCLAILAQTASDARRTLAS